MWVRCKAQMFLIILSCYGSIDLIWGNMISFKCFNNGLGRTPGLAQLMPRGLFTGPPDVRGISALHCSSLCVEQGNSCLSFAYHEGLCFLRNISLTHPGILCGISVIEGRLRCPIKRTGDAFVAFGGKQRRMMECMCGVQNDLAAPWSYIQDTSRYDCIDKCNTMPCLIKLGDINECWICNGNYAHCLPFKDPSPSYPQRVACMPIS